MSTSQTMRFAFAALLLGSTQALTTERRDGTPKFPYDDNTTSSCSYWVDYEDTLECAKMLAEE
jgi:hypothetical protein